MPLLAPAPQQGVGFRQGVILAWNPDTAENIVSVAGSVLTDLSILNGAEALLLQPGNVVGILTSGTSWFILGRITIPGTPEAVATLGAGLKVSYVVGSTSISSGSYALNGGPTVTTQVLSTGRVYITASSGADLDVGEGVALAVFGTGPGGATVSDICYLTSRNLLTTTSGTLGGTINTAASSAELATGLTPGSWTFELHSYKTNGVGNPDVHTRVLTVMPQ